MGDCSLLDLAFISILLVPVTPITTSTFLRYAELLSALSAVPVSELVLPKTASKFSQSLLPAGAALAGAGEDGTGGSVYLRFSTTNTEFPGTWNDLALSNTIMVVVGLMSCQEVGDLRRGAERFQVMCAKFPNALVHRCFAFDPLDSSSDNVPGLIMIPSVGDLTFYLTTMVQDMVSELFVEFGQLQQRLEAKSVISGPDHHGAGPGLAPLSGASPSPATGVPPMGSTTSLSPMPSAPALGGATMPAPPSAALTGGHLALSDARSDAAPTVAGFGLSLIPIEKNKRRTPARLLKYTGDLYLLAGRLDLAITTLTSVVDMCRNLYDFAWQASALESLHVATMLQLAKGVAPSVRPAEVDVILACRIHPELDKFMSELVERYRELLALYDRGISPFAPNYQPLPQTVATLRVMRLLASMGLTDYQTPILEGVGLPIPQLEGGKGIADIASGLTTLALAGKKEESTVPTCQGIARPGTASWGVRLNGYLPYLTASHAAWACVQAADIFRTMRYGRKSLFYAGHALSWGQEGAEMPAHGTQHLLNALIAQAQGLRCFEAGASSTRTAWSRLQVATLERIIWFASKLAYQSPTAIGLYPAVTCASLLLARFHGHYGSAAQRRLHASLEAAADSISPGAPEAAPSGVRLAGFFLINPHAMSQVKEERVGDTSSGGEAVFLFEAGLALKSRASETSLVAQDLFSFELRLHNPLAVEVEGQIRLWTAFAPVSGMKEDEDKACTSEPVMVRLPPEGASPTILLPCRMRVPGRLHVLGITLTRWHGRVWERLPLLTPLTFPVVEPMPRLEFLGAGVPSLNLLAGERSSLVLELRNAGSEIIDHVSVSVAEGESATAPSSTGSPNRDPMAAFERDVYVDSLSAFWLENWEILSPDGCVPPVLPSGDHPATQDTPGMACWSRLEENGVMRRLEGVNLGPGHTLRLMLGVYGKLGCQGASLTIRYGLRRGPDTVHTRALTKSLFLTVHAPLVLSNLDVLPCPRLSLMAQAFELHVKPDALSSPAVEEGVSEGSVPLTRTQPKSDAVTEDGSKSGANGQDTPSPDHHLSIEEMTMIAHTSTAEPGVREDAREFILTFDVKNVWIHPILLEFAITLPEGGSRTFTNLLHAGATKRMLFPLPKLFLDPAVWTQAIPTPKNRQFVLAVSELSPYQELVQRACFWYREHLLGGLAREGVLSTSWSMSKRRGHLSLRSLHLTGASLEVLREEAVAIRLSACTQPNGEALEVHGNRTLHAHLGVFVRLTLILTNHPRASGPVSLCLRILPHPDQRGEGTGSVSDNPMAPAWEASHTGLLVGGQLQAVVPPLDPGESWSTSLVLRSRNRGRFSFKYHAECIPRGAADGGGSAATNHAALPLDRLFTGEFQLYVH